MIISTRGWQIKDTDCSVVPDELVALTTKSAVPVKRTLEMVTVFPEKLNATGVPFWVTEILCLLEIFLTVAVMAAMQFSVVTGEVAGEVMVTSGAGITGHTPRVSPCAA